MATQKIINPSSLVGWWPMADFPSGTTTTDRSGNGHTGTLVNSPSVVPGKHGTAIEFTRASSQYINIADADDLTPANISIACWANQKVVSGYQRQVYVGKYDNATNQRSYFIGPASNTSANISFAISTNGTNYIAKDLGFTPTPGRWIHIVGTWGGTSQRAFVNGVEVTLTLTNSSGTPSGAIFNSTVPLRIGATVNQSSEPSYCSAYIDDVRIYNRVLSPGEVAEMYFAKKGND